MREISKTVEVQPSSWTATTQREGSIQETHVHRNLHLVGCVNLCAGTLAHTVQSFPAADNDAACCDRHKDDASNDTHDDCETTMQKNGEIGPMLAFKWCDKRAVYMLSTMHCAAEIPTLFQQSGWYCLMVSVRPPWMLGGHLASMVKDLLDPQRYCRTK